MVTKYPYFPFSVSLFYRQNSLVHKFDGVITMARTVQIILVLVRHIDVTPFKFQTLIICDIQILKEPGDIYCFFDSVR